jgi:membrane-associated protease RseP (regulator of RpoE activity)
VPTAEVAVAALLALVALVAVTTIHEAGHFLAVRAKGGRVLAVQLGLGGTAWRTAVAGTELVVAFIPVGGRIRYEGIRPGTGQAVIAVSGAAANLATAFLAFAVAIGSLGPEAARLAPEGMGPMGFAAATTGGWFWAVPGALLELGTAGSATELRAAVRGLVDLMVRRPLGAFPYALGALSALWAALNLIPIPGIETDGWHVVRALLRR